MHFQLDSKIICFYTLFKELFPFNAGKRVPLHAKFNKYDMGKNVMFQTHLAKMTHKIICMFCFCNGL